MYVRQFPSFYVWSSEIVVSFPSIHSYFFFCCSFFSLMFWRLIFPSCLFCFFSCIVVALIVITLMCFSCVLSSPPSLCICSVAFLVNIFLSGFLGLIHILILPSVCFICLVWTWSFWPINLSLQLACVIRTCYPQVVYCVLGWPAVSDGFVCHCQWSHRPESKHLMYEGTQDRKSVPVTVLGVSSLQHCAQLLIDFGLHLEI